MSSPQRTCVGCRAVVDQVELARFVLSGRRPTPDPTRNLPGRGAWLHPSGSCLDLALKRGGFARSFRRGVDASALQEAGWPDGVPGG